MKHQRDYDGSCFGIDLEGTNSQKMSEHGPTHAVLQETVYGWLNGTTIYLMSAFSHLTYADFVDHIGCDAQEFRFKSLGSKRTYTWRAHDKSTAAFMAVFSLNENGEWTVDSTGSVQINVPEEYINKFKK